MLPIHLGKPVLLGLLGIGLPKWLTDPYGYIRDKLIDLYNGLGHYVELWIVNPPHPLPGPWLDYLYGNAVGLAVYFVVVVGVISIPLMIISPRYTLVFLKSAVIAALIGGLYPVWFSAGNWFSDAGNSLTSQIAVHHGTSSDLLFLPVFHNVLGAILGIIALLFMGSLLLIVFFGYDVLFLVAMICGLPLFSLTPLGEGFRRRFEQLIGIVLVTSFLGRLAAVGLLSLTTLVAEHLPIVNNSFGSVLTLIIGFGLALWAQYLLLKHADRIYGNITGRTLGTSRVTGFVETRVRQPRRDMDMARIQNAHIASVTSVPVPSPVIHRPSLPPQMPPVTRSDRWAAFRRRRNKDS